jgi:hypothetical protein
MIVNNLSLLPFFCVPLYPVLKGAKEGTRKGHPITLVPHNGSYQLTKQLMIDILTFQK